MTLLTSNELNFLADLGTRWRLLYWNEFARLLREDDRARGARGEARLVAPLFHGPDRQPPRPGAKILAFTPGRHRYRGRNAL